MLIQFTFTPPDDLQQQLINSYPDITFRFQKSITADDPYLPEAKILVTYGEDLEDVHIQNAKRLEWVMVMSAGLERMPFKALLKKDIQVTNARGIHKIPMAEYTLGRILEVEKKMRELRELEKKHIWDRNHQFGELYGKTMVVIGAGAIGREVARLAKAFGMSVAGINRDGRPAEHFDRTAGMQKLMDEIPSGDYIVSVLPSTEETKHFLTEQHFNAMKESAIFINIGRGDAVEEKVLLGALRNGSIRHAVLDVFHEEPLPAEHPYWEMDTVTISPHISSISQNYLPRCFEIFEYNLQRFLKGKKDFKNEIDLERGY
ncbi:D-2-hydroxyacid dehydrogenase [Peribacillus sp. SCS-26]|uniref:D-2-hydroxyacid dehydrogenase n=1 Tax=Paraperibacillus marinus TaxID=3115295 RepID=UPI003906D1ED